MKTPEEDHQIQVWERSMREIFGASTFCFFRKPTVRVEFHPENK